ncbi:MAG: holo-ACP synthase [Victivallaceae bacterium]|jgi:holo-[acyl-carrier protein] synthase|nr:holo-ACP synthase [Victivallaceae bacterium]MDD3703498.1 holo-ACP synthase [Victivallaceae bacterium]MDD4317113.1 holo-ACP synthase [Victivallaceae bacterium]MDD5662947.1 holo-ACP synthase [Victivallaceae bacterium]NLK83501.1 holo-ACP synthase [Lentisphaerota bacterium]
MIYGLGTDIASIERLSKTIEKHGRAFIERVFTEAEQHEAAQRGNPVEYFTGRWCAKEALSKALGCGIGEQCSFLDICILNSADGAPELKLSGTALATAQKRGVNRVHVSISHERFYATATVIIEN